jgi:undecaprenyl diphosphate synthase
MENQRRIPAHVAIIMDGNGRWAQERNLPRAAGHRAGMDRVKEIVKAAAECKVKVLTLFAFSTENWTRPKHEVSMLMRSLNRYLQREIEELHRNNIRFVVIGRDDPIPGYLQTKMLQAQEKTKDNTGLTVVLALNYGSRQEIVDAARKFAVDVLQQTVSLESLDVEKFSSYLYTRGLPDPDLLIRTSGEMRISNFLLWQLSYAELYFPRKYWPDFFKADFKKALRLYQSRQRRFGGLASSS